MSRSAGRRRAGGATPDAGGGAPTLSAAPADEEPRPAAPRRPGWGRRLALRAEAVRDSRAPRVTWLVLVALAAAALVCAMVPIGPDWLGSAGSVAVAATFSWALAARTGGRPVVFGTVALLLAVGVVLTDDDAFHTGAAVMTCVVAAVLAVMLTVPAVTFARAARESVLAVLVAAVGALAVVGFEPATTVPRFEYATFGLAIVGAFLVVYRLGAGLHGLGRRGLVIVLVGAVVLAGTLLYAELLRRYGSSDLVESSLDAVRWTQDHLGASPRPVLSVLGIPALAYGCHMRARRRQGWWVCAFGAAATSAVGTSLVNPDVPLREAILAVVYGVVLGLVIAFVVIRLDVAITGQSKGSSRGRRSRRDEEATAIRPEPRRIAALL